MSLRKSQAAKRGKFARHVGRDEVNLRAMWGATR